MSWQLAQLNIARLRFDIDDPEVRDFVDGLDPVNAFAEASAGFVWRLQDEAGNATSVRMYDDPSIIVNMSVWASLDALLGFVRSPDHLSFLKRRREWFERPAGPYAALWWVPDGHQPTVAEAQERLEHLRDHGATPHAFSFSDTFPPPDDVAG